MGVPAQDFLCETLLQVRVVQGDSRANSCFFWFVKFCILHYDKNVFKYLLMFTALPETFMNGLVTMGWPHRRKPTSVVMLSGPKENASVAPKLLWVKMLSYYETWWSERSGSGFKWFLVIKNHTADTHGGNKNLILGAPKRGPHAHPLWPP